MAAELNIRFDRDGGSPVYEQIADGIRGLVASGDLPAGARLPTIRDLATHLGVNRDTIGGAYERLAADGVVAAHVGRGTFVLDARRAEPAAGVAEPAAFSPAVDRLLDFDRARVHYPDGDDLIRLHAVTPDPRLFPVEPFRRALHRVLGDAGASLLVYCGAQGHAGLREELAARLRAAGALVGLESIVLCHGASQGISLALRLFAESGDAIAVEEPTYHNVLGTILGLGLRAVPVPMRADGPDLRALETVLRRPEVKLFYTMPTFHNPMGTTTSLAHRRELLAVAARCGKPIVEDAFEMDLRLTGRPVTPLLGLDEAGLVVQLLSFSKSLFPGVRVGAIVARGRTVDALLALKHASDLGGALPLQAALADFLRSGAYERHLATLRARLRKRRDALLETLEAEMPEGTSWTRPEGGYQVWLQLPEPLDSRDLFADAARAGVLFAPGYLFHHDGRPSGALRLTFAMADETAIRRGVETLAGLARARLTARAPRAASVHV